MQIRDIAYQSFYAEIKRRGWTRLKVLGWHEIRVNDELNILERKVVMF